MSRARVSRSSIACRRSTASATRSSRRRISCAPTSARSRRRSARCTTTSTQLYDDLFIDTCDDWVIPYLADLLGTTHLKGEPRTLRADVADTIALRRRKGTLGAIERLAVNLTGWACRGVELRENLAGRSTSITSGPTPAAMPPYARRRRSTRFDVPRGGTAADPRSGGAGAARHAVRHLRLHRRRQAGDRRCAARQPAEPRDLPVAAGGLSPAR